MLTYINFSFKINLNSFFFKSFNFVSLPCCSIMLLYNHSVMFATIFKTRGLQLCIILICVYRWWPLTINFGARENSSKTRPSRGRRRGTNIRGSCLFCKRTSNKLLPTRGIRRFLSRYCTHSNHSFFPPPVIPSYFTFVDIWWFELLQYIGTFHLTSSFS